MTISLFSPPKSKPLSPLSIRGNDHDHANKSARKRKETGDYWLGKTLGKGSSGRVKLGYHKITGEKVAVKIISKAYLTSNASTEKAVKREIAIMKLIQHPHIVRLMDVIDVQGSPNLYLILEYVQGGELFEHLITKGRLSEKGARKYFQQIILAMDFCHRHLICHRDLKPENLLLDDEFNIKIADFGMASLQPSGTLLETSCGSPHYASPEIVTGIPYNGNASDIWSCGVILYALLCGHLPFDDNNIRELLYKVKRGKYLLPDHLSDLAKDLIRKILVVHPKKRLTMQQIQDHEWFKMDGIPMSSTMTPRLSRTDEIANAIQDPATIDERLLETLKTLWVGHSQEQLVDALMSRVYNMEKVAYHLLQRHSTKYWQTNHQDDQNDESGLCHQQATMTTAISIPIGKKTPRQQRPSSFCASDLPLSITPKPTTIPCRNGNEMDNLMPPPSPDVQRSSFHRKHAMDSTLHPVRLHPITLQRESTNQRSCRPPSPIVAQTQSLRNDPPDNTSKPKRMSLLAIQYHQRRILQQQQQQQQQQPLVDKIKSQAHQRTEEEMKQLIHDQEITTRQPSPGQSRLQSLLRRMDLHYDFSNNNNNNAISSQLRSPTPSASPTTRKLKTRLSIPLPKKSLPNDTKAIISRNDIKHSSNDTLCSIDPLAQQQQQQQAVPRVDACHIETRPSHPLMCKGSPLLASKARVASSSPRLEAPTIDSPKLSSWLPGLSHFKRPKIYTINCTAKDDKEAFGKVAQVIREQMNGSYHEQKDINGIMQSRGTIDISCDQGEDLWQVQKVRFRLEYYPFLNHQQHVGKTTVPTKEIKINFIQQQGDTAAFLRAVELVEKALDEYEKEAEFVSTANGWNLYGS